MALVIRMLCLGDSYTIGESVPSSGRWPVQLTARLRERSLEVADPVLIARTGWTTDELNAAIDDANPTGPYDIVTLLIGVNDQYRGRSAEEYRGQFRGLLARAIGFAGDRANRVIVLSIPDWGVTPFAGDRDRAKIGREIDEFNRINKEETRRAGARYVDITPISREAGANPALTAGDGLHPSAEMYRRWVKLVAPEAVGAVR